MLNLKAWGAGLLGLMCLASCGGGGGGGSDATRVTLSPASITSSFVSNDPATSGPSAISVTASFSPAITTVVYPVIAQDKPVLNSGPVVASRNPDGSYTVQLQPNGTLAAGSYSGNITLRLCKDPACASEYALSGAVLPYNFTVTAALSVSMKINGVPATDIRSFTAATSGRTFEITAASGDVITLDSSIPVTWVPVVAGTTAATVTPISSSTIQWQGTVAGSTSSGYIGITATPLDTRQTAGSFMIHLP